jgi:flagellar basal-body rod protein FlgF
MDKVLYTAMVAAKETELRKSVNANNISNAGTTGFKRQVVATRALDLFGAGQNTRAYAMTHTAGIDVSEGAIKYTGSSNDLTIRGDNWFVLHDGEDEYLAKNISFSVNPSGELVSSNGSKIATSQGGVLVPNNVHIEISSQGDVFFKSTGQPLLNKVATLKTVEARSKDIGVNLKGQVVSPGAKDVLFPQVVVGALQQSNINQVSMAMESMNLSSQFQMNMKIYGSAKAMSDSSNKLLGN